MRIRISLWTLTLSLVSNTAVALTVSIDGAERSTTAATYYYDAQGAQGYQVGDVRSGAFGNAYDPLDSDVEGTLPGQIHVHQHSMLAASGDMDADGYITVSTGSSALYLSSVALSHQELDFSLDQGAQFTFDGTFSYAEDPAFRLRDYRGSISVTVRLVHLNPNGTYFADSLDTYAPAAPAADSFTIDYVGYAAPGQYQLLVDVMGGQSVANPGVSSRTDYAFHFAIDPVPEPALLGVVAAALAALAIARLR